MCTLCVLGVSGCRLVAFSVTADSNSPVGLLMRLWLSATLSEVGDGGDGEVGTDGSRMVDGEEGEAGGDGEAGGVARGDEGLCVWQRSCARAGGVP